MMTRHKSLPPKPGADPAARAASLRARCAVTQCGIAAAVPCLGGRLVCRVIILRRLGQLSCSPLPSLRFTRAQWRSLWRIFATRPRGSIPKGAFSGAQMPLSPPADTAPVTVACKWRELVGAARSKHVRERMLKGPGKRATARRSQAARLRKRRPREGRHQASSIPPPPRPSPTRPAAAPHAVPPCQPPHPRPAPPGPTPHPQ